MTKVPRNLRRLAALAVALLLVLAVSLSPGAAALGVAVLFVAVLFSTGAKARHGFSELKYDAARFGDMAFGSGPPGRSMIKSCVEKSNCKPPGGRKRKKRFVMSMEYHGDRISRHLRSVPGFNGFFSGKASERASPGTMSVSSCEWELDFGLACYRARDSDAGVFTAA